MPCIRRRYHYGAIYIDDEHPELTGRALIGSMLDVTCRNGEIRRESFGGFVDIQYARGQRVKLANIEAYKHDGFFGTAEWLEFGTHSLMLGVYCNGQVAIVLDNGQPVVWCSYPGRPG